MPIIVPWILRESNAIELENQSARYIGLKHKPYNKVQYFLCKIACYVQGAESWVPVRLKF